MKRTLRTPDSATGGTQPKETEQQTIRRLTAHNAELQGQVDEYKIGEAQRAADEKIIVEKMAHGLSRQQAMNVIHRQREFDAAQDKSKARRPSASVRLRRDAKSKIEPAKKYKTTPAAPEQGEGA